MKVLLSDIEKARKVIKGIVRATEIDKSYSASRLIGREVFLKFENTQFTGSFKLRGAYNKISQLSEAEKARGVVASSAGNHAQGVAFSAQKAGVKATIVMPEIAPLIKVEATRGYGAEIILHGEVVDDSTARARELEKEENMVFVHPYEDEQIIAGQGTIGLEIYESLPDVDTVLVPIGGGGLISGIATAIKAKNPRVRVIGVTTEVAKGMSELFHHREFNPQAKKISTIADGINIKRPSQRMYDFFISKLVDEVVTVSDDEIAEAIVFLLERAKTVTEGAGAAAMAALLSRKLDLGQKICVVLGGGNIDLNVVSKIIEKGQIRKGRLCELSIVIDDLPGNLLRMTAAIAGERANVLEVHHDRISQGLFLRETKVDFVLETTGPEHIEKIKAALIQAGGRILP